MENKRMIKEIKKNQYSREYDQMIQLRMEREQQEK